MSRHTKAGDERRNTEQARARRHAQQKKARKPKRPPGARYANPDKDEDRNLRKASAKNGMVELEAHSRKSTRKSPQHQKPSSMMESLTERGMGPKERARLKKKPTRHRKPRRVA